MTKMRENGAFWIGLFFLYLLCFSAQLGSKDNGDPITVMEYFLDQSDEMLWRIQGDISVAFSCRGGSWLQLFLPILGSVGFVYLYGLEKNTTFERYEIFRTGRYCHRSGRFLAAITAGGLQLAGAFGLFCISLIARYDLWRQTNWLGLIVIIAEMFLYGGLFAMPALTFCVWMENVYLITSFSFLLWYLPERLSYRLMGQAVSDITNIDTKLLFWACQINPMRLGELCTKSPYQKAAIVEAVLLFVICFVAYVFGKKE